MVVNDDKIVNAAASYGLFSKYHIVQQRNWSSSPEGNIVVFTGILPVARDEQGLAAILGHGKWLDLITIFSINWSVCE